jgi:hypothetical protein
MTTNPSFSSRSTVQHTKQFPHRDEEAMSEHQPEPGFSNSEPVEDAPKDVLPEIQEPDSTEPGFSNSKAVGGDEAEAKVVESAQVEDKSVATKAAKKTAAKKG